MPDKCNKYKARQKNDKINQEYNICEIIRQDGEDFINFINKNINENNIVLEIIKYNKFTNNEINYYKIPKIIINSDYLCKSIIIDDIKNINICQLNITEFKTKFQNSNTTNYKYIKEGKEVEIYTTIEKFNIKNISSNEIFLGINFYENIINNEEDISNVTTLYFKASEVSPGQSAKSIAAQVSRGQTIGVQGQDPVIQNSDGQVSNGTDKAPTHADPQKSQSGRQNYLTDPQNAQSGKKNSLTDSLGEEPVKGSSLKTNNDGWSIGMLNPKSNPNPNLNKPVDPITGVPIHEVPTVFVGQKKGGSKPSPKRTKDSIVKDGRKYLVYVGPRGGKYIRQNGKYVSTK